MDMKDFLRRNPLVWPVVLLALLSVVGLFMVAGRVVLSRRVEFFNLPWNLFLAWVPLFFALAVRFVIRRNAADLGITARKQGLLIGFLSVAWLFFLPNAPYLLTDLVHLPARGYPHYFPDMMLILHFALLGLALGFVSLHVMHSVVERRYGWVRGWLFIAMIAGLSGVGVYIGRVMRWNSWDAFIRPWAVAADVLEWTGRLWNRPLEILVPTLFGSTILVAYLLFASLLRPSLASVGREEKRELTLVS